MLGFNHTIAGVLIAVAVKEPLLVAPLAVASHFAMDALPHHGNDPAFIRGTASYNRKVVLDGILSLLVYAAAIIMWPTLFGIITVGAFFAILPDLFWPLALHIKQTGPLWAFFKFHKRIQQYETPGGAWVEYGWAILTGGLLLSRI